MKKIYGTVSSRGVEAPIVNMMKINKTMDEENVVKMMKIFPQNDMKKFNQSFSRFIIFFISNETEAKIVSVKVWKERKVKLK